MLEERYRPLPKKPLAVETRSPRRIDVRPPLERREQFPGERPAVSGVRKLLFLMLAGLFFALGALGAILPVLPATPFLLLTSYFLVLCSPRLNQRLLRSPLLGPILTDWQVNGGVRPDVKVQAIVMVVVVVGLTIFFSGYALVPSAIIALLAAIGIVVIVRLPVARR